MKPVMSSQIGFTLIELMIVILIIAILVAIAVPVFLLARAGAQRRTCQANLRTVDGTLNTYTAQYGVYPPNGAVGTLLVPSFIKRDPTCPTTGSTYALVNGNPVLDIPPQVTCPTAVSGHTI